ncbi:MAG: serine protein kinase RIO [Nanoarchaeota archaeon]
MAKKTSGHREAFKTMGDVFDLFTERTVQKLISQGYLDGLITPIKMGKEANVFLGKKGEGQVAVKIYRLSTCDFNRMYEYMKSDPRFGTLVRKRRKVIFAWTQREFRNLMIAHEAGVRVPVPHAGRNNVLVMDLIGNPAQQLKQQPPEDPQNFFNEVVRMMKKLHAARLVHADLSEYNILNDDEKPVFIDMSQATTYDNTSWQMYLDRDVHNIARYFGKLGVKITDDKLKDMIING